MMSRKDMADLVERAAQGDTSAFALLYEEHLDPIYRFVFYRVQSREDAEDLTQTVFMKAWRALPNMREGSMVFSSWLYTIARNTIIDYWKKKRDVRIDDEENFFGSIPDHQATARERTEAVDSFDAVKGALGGLSDEQQELIILRFFEDRSTEEIAEIMSRNPAAVRALQYRAIKRLKELTGECI